MESPDQEKINQSGMGAGIDAITNSFRYVFLLLTIFIIGTIVWYFTFRGYYTVNPQETVIVLRFGKITDVFKDDWHWSFPYPVSKLVRIPTNRQVMLIKNFWPNPVISMSSEEDSAQAMAQPLVPGRDGALLTGDANIIHTEWEIVYEISDPLTYYKTFSCPTDPKEDDEIIKNPHNGRFVGSRGPRTMIAAIVENEIIKATAVQKVQNALYKEVTGYQDSVKKGIRDALLTQNLGVTLNSVLLKSKTPPFSTVGAFNDVINAEQESSSSRHKAENYALRAEQEAETESKSITVDAEVYRSRVVSEIESESIYFTKILAEYRNNQQSVIIPLYSETVVSLLRDIKDKYIVPEASSGESQELRIMLSPEPNYKKNGENENNSEGK